MAEGLNRVMLLGNLGADPELRTTQSGEGVLRLRLATTERYLDRNKAWQERTEWHNVTVWGKRGEALHRILAKGSTIFVEGSLRTSSYENKEGQKVYKTEVIAQNIILAGGRSGRAGAGPSDEFDQFAPRGGGDRPGGGPPRGGNPPPARQQPQAAGGDFGDDYGGGGGDFGADDDIPF
ncbi:MAG TPA: single-stranded DNA-binding protein [Polyangiaceae bacterium]|nr:single-stranded DNA-binding protein [Polyangiaceae bacterium]